MRDLEVGKLVLTVNGRDYEGFEAGTVNLTMEDPCNTFDLDYVADGKQPTARGIFPGDECELFINAGRGAESLIRGYVDTTDDTDAADAIQLRCAGRSKTSDLEDCSAHTKPGAWKNVTVSRIATAIAKPYGVPVFLEGDEGGPLAKFSIVPGETAFEAIQRACLRRGLVCYSVSGHLVITTAGSLSTLTSLERGINVVRSSRADSWHARYSEYVFTCQVPGSDDRSGRAVMLKATAKDATVRRFRRLTKGVSASSQTELQGRADLECSRRAGLGEKFRVVVDGWGTRQNKVWRPNMLVNFTNPVLGVDAELIISSVTFSFGPNAPREAELILMRPEAYLPEDPYPELKRGAMF